jgi:aryl-alcohol dehydrogenase-like predicted oxidoreductase
MEIVQLGKSGLRVSRLCLGTMTYGSKSWRDWVLEADEARPFFEQALEAGINFFDTADVYSNGESEIVLGQAIRDLVPDREDVVIATKCYLGTESFKTNRFGLSRKHIVDACERSLKRLGTDYIDLYQIHRFDPTVPMEETLGTLSSLVDQGKVRYIGASSMYAWQFAQYLALADTHGWHRFVSMQNYYNLAYREEEREMLVLCEREGIGVIPWSPLARGYLARDSFQASQETLRGKTDEFAEQLYSEQLDAPVIERNAALARELGVKPAQTALAWLLSRSSVTAPIIGASKAGHLEDALAALELELTPEQLASLEEPYQPHPVLGGLV